MYSACVLCSKLSCHISDVGTWICSSTLLKCSSSRYAIWRTSWSVVPCSIIGWELLSCVIRNSFGTMSDLTEPLMNAQKTQLEPEAEHDLEAHVFSRMVSLMVVGRHPSENPFDNSPNHPAPTGSTNHCVKFGPPNDRLDYQWLTHQRNQWKRHQWQWPLMILRVRSLRRCLAKFLSDPQSSLRDLDVCFSVFRHFTTTTRTKKTRARVHWWRRIALMLPRFLDLLR